MPATAGDIQSFDPGVKRDEILQRPLKRTAVLLHLPIPVHVGNNLFPARLAHQELAAFAFQGHETSSLVANQDILAFRNGEQLVAELPSTLVAEARQWTNRQAHSSRMEREVPRKCAHLEVEVLRNDANQHAAPSVQANQSLERVTWHCAGLCSNEPILVDAGESCALHTKPDRIVEAGYPCLPEMYLRVSRPGVGDGNPLLGTCSRECIRIQYHGLCSQKDNPLFKLRTCRPLNYSCIK